MTRGNRSELELALVLEGSGGAAPAGAKVPIEDRHCDADGIRAEREQQLHVLDPRHHGLPGRIVDAAAAGELEVVVASRASRRFLNSHGVEAAEDIGAVVIDHYGWISVEWKLEILVCIIGDEDY